ncbi:MAG: hypothetical protein K6357_02100 [Elusimicrobiota bacterium]
MESKKIVTYWFKDKKDSNTKEVEAEIVDDYIYSDNKNTDQSFLLRSIYKFRNFLSITFIFLAVIFIIIGAFLSATILAFIGIPIIIVGIGLMIIGIKVARFLK